MQQVPPSARRYYSITLSSCGSWFNSLRIAFLHPLTDGDLAGNPCCRARSNMFSGRKIFILWAVARFKSPNRRHNF